ncbi:MAG: hypothetical protein KC713_00765, partial [Candidatus Omnitrophica bacterium]|nr:hypothetical protein [Candidatus Omnitrophota bacterium]
DAVNFEQTAQLIYQHGWGEFFRTGPHREPLYASMIAMNMYLGDVFHVHYQWFQKAQQMILLFLSQLGVVYILRKLRVHEIITLTLVGYMGFSPALINTGLSLFSEILTLFLGVCCLIVCSEAYLFVKAVERGSLLTAFRWGCFMALVFVAAVFSKGVFQLIFYAALIPFIQTAVLSSKVHRRLVSTSFISTVSALVIFVLMINGYKNLNQKYNGHYQLTNRHYAIFASSAYKRAEPVNQRIMLSHLVSIPGNGVCQIFFDEDTCRYADWYGSWAFNKQVDNDMRRLSWEEEDDGNRIMFDLALDKMRSRPFQYLFFTLVEALKMPFWESTRIGFVTYPGWLASFYSNKIIRYGLRLCIAIEMFTGVFMLGIMAMGLFFRKLKGKGARKFSRSDQRIGPRSCADSGLASQGKCISHEKVWLGFLILMLCIYTGLYATCYVITRYSVVMAPYFLIIYGYTLDRILLPRLDQSYAKF